MSGRQSKRASVKFSFSAGTPQKVKTFWGESIEWMKEVFAAEDIAVKRVLIHFHDSTKKNKCPLGEADGEEFMLCTSPYDKDTILHELAHVCTPGTHSREWANQYLMLVDKYLDGESYKISMWAAHRDYPTCRRLIGDLYDL
jgi:hypothetical protein